MTEPNIAERTLRYTENQTVSALYTEAPEPFACLVLAHGAGAGMRHPFMGAVAEGLARRGVSTLRYQFPYMEAGSRRVDNPPLAHLAVRAAVVAAGNSLPLFAGGKSFGGRMTSQAQADGALPGVCGLVFFGFPLHPARKPSTERSVHLSDVGVPMLFMQGTRDALADAVLIEQVTTRLGAGASLVIIDGADHSFHVPARIDRKDEQVLGDILDSAAEWMRQVVTT